MTPGDRQRVERRADLRSATIDGQAMKGKMKLTTLGGEGEADHRKARRHAERQGGRGGAPGHRAGPRNRLR